MSKYEELYQEIISQIPDAKAGKMFGVPCIKAPNGKACSGFHGKFITVKLNKKDQADVMAWDGVRMFTPSETRPPMNGWLEISTAYSEKWSDLAKRAFDFVKKL